MKNTEKKKSLGRQKIEIKKIEKKNNLQVTFSKRRKGLIKKAGELSVLCGVDIAVIVQSPAGKVHAFGNIPVESIMDRYLEGNPNCTLVNIHHSSDEHEKKCLEIMKKLEVEKEVEKVLEESKAATKLGLWWDQPFDNLDLNELGQYMEAMEVLKNNLMNKAVEKASSSSSKANNNNEAILIPNVSVDCFGGVPVPHFDQSNFASSTTTSSKPLFLLN